MSGHLNILSAGPAMSVQDMGRSGYLAYGLTRGGAADTLAMQEGAALLRQGSDLAAVEMVGVGGTFQADADIVIALTGARMTANIDGAPVVWGASHRLPAGAKLTIGGALEGVYGYLHVAGGIDTAPVMGARATHLNAGIGRLLEAGDCLPVKSSEAQRSGDFLVSEPRFSGGEVRVVPSIQTEKFAQETIRRFENTAFTRDVRGNRQGVRMSHKGDGFFADGGLSIVSEVISEGDIQLTGDGSPYVLMCECQTTGGYPRIGTVIPSDLPRVAQAASGMPIRFSFVTLDEAREIETKARSAIRALPGRVAPLVRDPHDIADLLSYRLIDGAISATADPFET